MTIEKQTIGDRIRAIREEKRLTLAALGALLGLGKSAVSQYEHNVTSPSPETLAKIAEIGERSIDWLVTGRNREQTTVPPTREEALKEAVRSAFQGDVELAKGICEAAGLYSSGQTTTDAERLLLDAYRLASEEIKKAALRMLEESANESRRIVGGGSNSAGLKSA